MRCSRVGAIRIYLSLSVLLVAFASHADVTKGPYTFEDNAFVDALIGTGGVLTAIPAGNFLTNLTDTSLATRVLVRPGAFMELAFTDNVVVNGPGTDLVIFESRTPTAISLTIELDGATQTVVGSVPLFSGDGINTNAIEIDLTDFGFADGDEIAELRITHEPGQTSASISAIAALNNASVKAKPVIETGLAGKQVPFQEIAGISPDAAVAWKVASGEVSLRSDGELKVEALGLLLPDDTIGVVVGVFASLVCQKTASAGAGEPTNEVVASTSEVPLSAIGTMVLEEVIAVPPVCVAPIVLVRVGSVDLGEGPIPIEDLGIPAPWIATGGF